MQHWTNKKPDREGFWWGKSDNETTFIHYIKRIEGQMYFTFHFEDMVLILTHPKFDNYLWGSAPICEPVGEKI